MNKSVIIGAVVVLVAAGGYYQFSYKPAQEAAETAAQDAAAAATLATAEAEAAAAAAAAETAAADAAAAAETAAADAAAAADSATGATTGAASDTAGDAAIELPPADLLTVENFDAVKVNALIDASALEASVKTTLKARVEAAAATPALLEPALAEVKAALGL